MARISKTVTVSGSFEGACTSHSSRGAERPKNASPVAEQDKTLQANKVPTNKFPMSQGNVATSVALVSFRVGGFTRRNWLDLEIKAGAEGQPKIKVLVLRVTQVQIGWVSSVIV